jgi:hypothetical protein
MVDKMGDPPSLRMQDLDDPPASMKATIKSDVQPVTKWNGSYQFYDQTHDVTLGGVYVHIDHRNAMRGDQVVRNEYLKQVNELAECLGIKVGDVYGIPRTHKRVPKKNPGWSNYFTIVEAKVKELIDQHQLSQQIADRKEWEAFGETKLDNVIRLLDKHNLKPAKARSQMAKAIEAYAAVTAGVPNLSLFNNLTKIVEKLGIEVKASKPHAELVKLSEEAEKRYGLLTMVGGCISATSGPEMAAEVLDYINLKD